MYECSDGFGEFRVWQLLSLHQFQERIAEQKFVVPIVKAMFQFIQIGVQMLRGKFVIRVNEREELFLARVVKDGRSGFAFVETSQ